ncbi:MAG TPA: class I SAM-dependent methyltransferase [Kofleriaceae bacterium]|nr:class I SAM-dependent methyltransferase [Kofleriaceae bacterium]
MDWRKQIVRRGYDSTADEFAAARGPGPEARWLDRLLGELPAGARVLDLGCGNGEPIAARLAAAGLAVTGVDLSAEQVRRAAARVPGQFLIADMAEVEFAPASFAAAIAWDSAFHLPPAEQPALFARVRGWLAPGAPFVVTLGATAGELHTHHLGQPIYYGALEPDRSRRELEAAGFTIELGEIDDPDDGGHLVLYARAAPAP